MASKNYQYGINTENCATLSDLAQKIYMMVRKNDEILARLTGLVDTKLRLPNLDSNENEEFQSSIIEAIPSEIASEQEIADLSKKELTVQNSEGRETSGGIVKSAGAQSAQSDTTKITSISHNGRDDYLRNHLDVNLKIGSVQCDEASFQNVTNSHIRQLLQDNYRLLEIKTKKQQENRELYRVFKTYERLFVEVIIPKLTQDMSRQSINKIAAARAACMEQRFPLENEVWQAYCEYMGHLEKVRSVVCNLVNLLNGHLHSDQIERLTMQMNIVEILIASLKTGDLRRSTV